MFFNIYKRLVRSIRLRRSDLSFSKRNSGNIIYLNIFIINDSSSKEALISFIIKLK